MEREREREREEFIEGEVHMDRQCNEPCKDSIAFNTIAAMDFADVVKGICSVVLITGANPKFVLPSTEQTSQTTYPQYVESVRNFPSLPESQRTIATPKRKERSFPIVPVHKSTSQRISVFERIVETPCTINYEDDEGIGDCHYIVPRVFSGILMSDVTCTICGFTSTTYDSCWHLSRLGAEQCKHNIVWKIYKNKPKPCNIDSHGMS